jgi:peptidoglycan hydrolase CwlO-like protein
MGNAMNDHPYDEQAKYYEERECLMQERIDYLKVEIEYLQNDRKERIDKWMELLEEKDKHIEHLQDEIVNLEALAKDRYCAMQTKIEVFYDAIYEIAYLDPIRRIQGDAQRIARQALENYYNG